MSLPFLASLSQNKGRPILFATQQLSMGAQKIDVVTQQEAVVEALITAGDAVTTASLYKKVFGDCCDVPQNTDNGGCGCS